LEKEDKYLDKYISSRITNIEDVEDVDNKFSDALTKACNKSFKISRAAKKTKNQRTVPWWKEDVTIARKRVNPFRRKYQSTRNKDKLRVQSQTDYQV
jgi:hypothetical protein